MKRLIFTLLYRTGLTRLLAWRTRGQVKILCYHSVTLRPAETDPYKLHLPEQLFRAHLKQLRNNYRVIPLQEYVAARRANRALPYNTVVLTFDDGFRNFHTVAAPILAEFGFPATVFIITGKTQGDTTEESPQPWQPADDQEHLSWAQARTLALTQRLEIGSHTHTHPRLPDLPLIEAQRELTGSMAEIRSRLGPGPTPLSYPHGQTSLAIKQLAQAAGYTCALSSELGGNGADADLFALRRVVIAADDDSATFAARVAGLTWGRQQPRHNTPGNAVSGHPVIEYSD